MAVPAIPLHRSRDRNSLNAEMKFARLAGRNSIERASPAVTSRRFKVNRQARLEFVGINTVISGISIEIDNAFQRLLLYISRNRLSYDSRLAVSGVRSSSKAAV
jgi:hypothetical protein